MSKDDSTMGPVGNVGSVKVAKGAAMYMPPNADSLPELTLRGIILGALITIVFTASNVYLGLKVGLTFSSSIPAAVISMAVLSFFSRANILENNMVQTQASAAGTLSAVIFVLPAILMVGYWNEFHFWQTMLICLSGGILGVIFSIPLRRTMVAHSNLPYPEGVAAAEILHAGHMNDPVEDGALEEAGKADGARKVSQSLPRPRADEGDMAASSGNGAKHILFGGILAAIVAFCTSGLHIFTDKLSFWVNKGSAVFQIPLGFSLALFSAGYLMGITGGFAMVIGCFLAWGVFVPSMTMQLPELDLTSITAMADAASALWSSKVRFIGAGTLAIAAVWTLLTLLRPMLIGIKLSFQALSNVDKGGPSIDRTDEDMSIKSQIFVMVGVLLLLVVTFYSFVKDAPISPLAAWGLVAFAVAMVFFIGFFIASACGYMAGLIGSSNSPISGIGVIAIIVVSALLVIIGSSADLFTSEEARRFGMSLAIFITTAIVSVGAISNDNLQDLKTGLIVGATPKNQQIALIIGCIIGAMIIAPTLGLLYQAYGFAGAPLARPGMDPNAVLSAPQATLMMTVATGIFSHNLDWNMFLTGIGVGAVVIIIDLILGKLKSPLRLAALAVGLGIYLPPNIVTAIIVGSLVSVFVKRRAKAASRQGNKGHEDSKSGVLIASGFIVGESLMGVILAIAVLASLSLGFSDAPFGLDALMASTFGDSASTVSSIAGLTVFALVCAVFYRKALKD